MPISSGLDFENEMDKTQSSLCTPGSGHFWSSDGKIITCQHLSRVRLNQMCKTFVCWSTNAD